MEVRFLKDLILEGARKQKLDGTAVPIQLWRGFDTARKSAILITSCWSFPASSSLLFAAMSPAKESALPHPVIGVDSVLTKHQYGYPLSRSDAVTWLWYRAVWILGARMFSELHWPAVCCRVNCM